MATEFHGLRPFVGSGTLPAGTPCLVNSDRASQAARSALSSASSGGAARRASSRFDRPPRRVVRLSADARDSEPGPGLSEEGKSVPASEEVADSMSEPSGKESVAVAAADKTDSKGLRRPALMNAKDWVNLWWPTAMESSRDNELAMLEASENFNAWIVLLVDLIVSGAASATSEAKEGLDDAKVGLRALLGYTAPAPEPVAPEKKPPFIPFVPGKLGPVTLPIFKSFGGKDQASEPKPKTQTKPALKTAASKPSKSSWFQLPILKAKETKVAADKSGVKAKPPVVAKQSVKQEEKRGAKAKPLVVAKQSVEQEEKRERGFTLPSPLPIVQSLTGGSEEKESILPEETKTKEEAAAMSTPAAEPLSTATDETTKEVETEMEPAKQTTTQGSAVKAAYAEIKEELPAQQDLEVSKRQEVGSIVPSGEPSPASRALDRLSTKAGLGTDKASTSDDVGKGQQSTVTPGKAEASEPSTLGTGRIKAAAKSSGGAVGGPFSLGPKDALKTSQPGSRATGEVALSGGGGRGGVSGGDGGGNGGDGFGSGGSEEEPERKFPFGNLVLLSILTAAVVTAVLWRMKASKKEKPNKGSQGVGLKAAES